ncbi:MAG: hypothetical protein K5790_04205 [Nitrosopumilus sp.]|uniref:hypothetical protein n=1 Tax=Nitrosopumilus sp. TaxID=2024843 RepID=UPI00247EF3F7|nr:hypothetical protein [Nitrosopumilus sp.]MCV0392481.1 hypothetical protein [Nitrosopumilus sp.]
MNDEFIEVATNEIASDIAQIEKIMNSCKTDDDVFGNASKFQIHTHKIKGLAPMMGKEKLGMLSASLDSLFKNMISGTQYENIFIILSPVVDDMRHSLNEPNYELSQIIQRIEQVLSNERL